MRDPKRIGKILDRLRQAWEENPDLRLGQIIAAAAMTGDRDTYYTEDDVLIARIEEVCVTAPDAGQGVESGP